MVREFYGPTAVVAPTPDPADGTAVGYVTTTMSVYRARTGGTAETSLLTPAGAAITTVTPDASGYVQFQGPDGYRGSLWLQDPAPGGLRWEVKPAGFLPAAADITDATSVGRAVLKAADEAAARAAMSAVSTAEVSALVVSEMAAHPAVVTYNEGSPIPSGYPNGTLYVMIPAGVGAPVFTQKAVGGSATDGTGFSFTPTGLTAGRVWLLHTVSGATTDQAALFPALAGGGFTFEVVKQVKTGLGRVASQLLVCTGTPNGSAITLTHAAAQQNAMWRLIECENIKATGTVVQSDIASNSTTSPQVTLPGVVARNPVVSFYAVNSIGQSIAAGADYTEFATQQGTTDSPAIKMAAAYRLPGANLANWVAGVDATTGTGAQKVVIAAELAAA